MAADGLGPAAQDGLQPVGQVFGFFGVRHQGHARGKFGLALDQGAAKLQDLFQHAADGRCQSARRLEGRSCGERIRFAVKPLRPRVRCPGEVPGPGLTAADQLGSAVDFALEVLGAGPDAYCSDQPVAAGMPATRRAGWPRCCGGSRGAGGRLGIEPEGRRRVTGFGHGEALGDWGCAVLPSVRGQFMRIARAVGSLPAQGIDFLDFAYATQPSHHP